MRKTTLGDDLSLVATMTKRNVKLFLKDKVSVFFSMFAPLIVLVLYVLFLRKVQMDGILGTVPEGAVSQKLLGSFLDAWMLAGATSVACITVALSSANVMVQDKSRGILLDSYSSPVKRGLVRFSYFLGDFIVSSIICLLVLAVSWIYLAASGGFFLNVGDCFALVGTTLLSVLSSTAIMIFAASFLKTESALGGLVGILSAASGFLIGAYMPLSMFPKEIRYAVGFLPGTYSAGLFRNLFMQPALNEMLPFLPPEIGNDLAVTYSLRFDFFGADVTMTAMFVVLLGSIVLFSILNAVVFSGKRRAMPTLNPIRADKKKKSNR